MTQNAHPRVRALLLDQRSTLLWAEVINRVDALDLESDAANHLQHLATDTEAGDDDGDAGRAACHVSSQRLQRSAVENLTCERQ